MIEVIKEEQRFRPLSPIQTEAPAGPEIAIVDNEIPSVVPIKDTIVVPGDDPKRRPIDNQRTVIDQRTALPHRDAVIPPVRPDVGHGLTWHPPDPLSAFSTAASL